MKRLPASFATAFMTILEAVGAGAAAIGTAALPENQLAKSKPREVPTV